MITHLWVDYPVSELQRARDEFWYRWNQALTHSHGGHSVVSHVVRQTTYLSRAHPPAIYMRNTWPYPFDDENDPSLNPPAGAFMSSYAHPPRPPATGALSSASKRVHVESSALGKLTEQAVTEVKRQKRQQLGEQSEHNKVVYICDACDVRSGSRADATTHLVSTKGDHATCSRYTEDVEASSLMMSVPREVTVESGKISENFGWKKDDLVVHCPTCHLIMTDKIQCAHHHETIHCETGQRVPAYAFGRVLQVVTISLDRLRPSCKSCGARVSSLTQMANHWFRQSPTCSPIQPPDTNGSCPLAITIECLHCKRQRDHTCPAHNGAAQTHEDILRTANFLSNGLLTHLERARDQRVAFRLRFIQLKHEQGQAEAAGGSCGGRLILPPPDNQSQAAQLLFSMRETQATQHLLRTFKKSHRRKALSLKVNALCDRLNAAVQKNLSNLNEAM